MPDQERTLTRGQKKLLAEVRTIAQLARLNYENIADYDVEERSTRLRVMKNQIIRSEVIANYTFVDEMLGAAICHYFFGRKRGFMKLWRTKKFKAFNHYILEVLSVSEKLRLVKAITKVPKAVAADIEALNNLRNGLAHAFFPENLRSSKPIYKGKNIFTIDGLERLVDDMVKITSFFFTYNFGIRDQAQQADRQPEAVVAAVQPLVESPRSRSTQS